MRVILATDGSEGARAAAELLVRLPLPPSSEVLVLTVLEGGRPLATPDPSEVDDARALRSTLEREADELLAREAERLLPHGLSVRTRAVEGHAADAVLEAAERERADLVALGALGAGARGRFPMGSVAKAVVKHAACSVLVGRPRTATPGEPPAERLSVLLAYDGSPPARAALDLLAHLPLGESVAVTVLTVLTVGTTLYRQDIRQRLSASWQAYREEAEQGLVVAAEALAAATPHVATRLIDGGPEAGDEVLEAAELLATDLIVVGRTGLSAVRRFLLGSVSTQVVEHAPCSVLVCAAPPEAPGDD